jgi:hypothetical protein
MRCTATKHERASTQARKRGALGLVERLVGMSDVEDDQQIVQTQRRLLRPHVLRKRKPPIRGRSRSALRTRPVGSVRMRACVRACVCVYACVRACVRVCARARASASVGM